MSKSHVNGWAGEIENLQAQLAAAQERVSELAKQMVEMQHKFARGSVDVTAAAQQVSLEARVESLLANGIWTLDTLARELDVSTSKTLRAMKPLRDRLYNIGTEDRPRWTLTVGNEVDIAVLTAQVGRLLREKPMDRKELLAATGASDNRIGGALRRLQREGARVENWGSARYARWVIVPERSDRAVSGDHV